MGVVWKKTVDLSEVCLVAIFRVKVLAHGISRKLSCLIRLRFDLEEEGSSFLQHIGKLPPDYTLPRTRR